MRLKNVRRTVLTKVPARAGDNCFEERCTRIIDQACQPSDQLWGASMEPGPMAIGTLLVIAAGNGIQKLVMDLHAKALFVMLPQAKRVQHLARFRVAAGVQRVPTVFLRPTDHLPADDRAHGLFGGFVLEHRACLRDADLFGPSPHTDAGLLIARKRVGRQALPSPDAARITTGPQGDLQVLRRLGQIHQGPHVRIALAGAGVKQGVQRRRLAVAKHAAGQQTGDIAEFDIAGRGLDGGETAAGSPRSPCTVSRNA